MDKIAKKLRLIAKRFAKAPPGDKYERMVKHIKKQNRGKAKDKQVNPFAVAWSKYNEGRD